MLILYKIEKHMETPSAWKIINSALIRAALRAHFATARMATVRWGEVSWFLMATVRKSHKDQVLPRSETRGSSHTLGGGVSGCSHWETAWRVPENPTRRYHVTQQSQPWVQAWGKIMI